MQKITAVKSVPENYTTPLKENELAPIIPWLKQHFLFDTSLYNFLAGTYFKAGKTVMRK